MYMIYLCRFKCSRCVILAAVDEDQVLFWILGFIVSKTADFYFTIKRIIFAVPFGINMFKTNPIMWLVDYTNLI